MLKGVKINTIGKVNYVRILKKLQRKIEFKIFICVKIMNIKILILIKNYRHKIIY